MKYKEYQLAIHGPRATVYARINAARAAVVDAEVAKLLEAGCKRISEFPSYLVSPGGDVYSTNRTKFIKVRPGTKPGGYQFVGIHSEAGAKYKMVHRLVAIAFLPNPTNAPAVNHIDGRSLRAYRALAGIGQSVVRDRGQRRSTPGKLA